MKTVLIGNGLNRCSNGTSWKQLLIDLIISIDKESVIGIENPFPLIYEEIVLRGVKFRNINEDVVLNSVCHMTNKIRINELHRLILGLDVDNILTTNYDYTLESCGDGIRIRSFTSAMKSSETDYRLHTFTQLNGKRFWHIHGEVDAPKTIVLGYKKYSNNIRQLVSYYEKDLQKRISNNSAKIMSWVDFFFYSDVYIIGFGLDYTEIDIWWLLNARARYFLTNQEKNDVHFFLFVEKNENKSELKSLLESHDVIVHTNNPGEKYEDFYRRAIEMCNNNQGNYNNRSIG